MWWLLFRRVISTLEIWVRKDKILENMQEMC